MSQKAFDWYVGSATACNFLAMIVWLMLFKRIHKGVWSAVFAGMCLVGLHCAGYFTGNLMLSQLTALSNSALALFAVIMTWRGLNRRDRERRQFENEMASKTSVAEELAKLLNVYKSKLAFYERQAKEQNLPVFDEKSDG